HSHPRYTRIWILCSELLDHFMEISSHDLDQVVPKLSAQDRIIHPKVVTIKAEHTDTFPSRNHRIHQTESRPIEESRHLIDEGVFHELSLCRTCPIGDSIQKNLLRLGDIRLDLLYQRLIWQNIALIFEFWNSFRYFSSSQ